MQLIRAYQIFCFLRDRTVHRRQKLRTDRRVKYIQQHLLKFLIAAGFRIIPYQITHQRLGHTGIHTVHGHVIPVVGSPSQRQLRHIARPDDQAACTVGHIHQDLGTLSGLCILIRHIMMLHILSDIPEMYRYCFLNINLLQLHSQRTRQLTGIIIGSVRGAKARHGHGCDPLPVQSQQIKSTHRHQKRQRRIQPAGNAHHR